MTFCNAGLVSASEDCSACLWDVVNWVIIRRFSHQKGPITNLVVIPQTSLVKEYNRIFHVSLLEKYPHPSNLWKEINTPLSPSSFEDDHVTGEFRSTALLNQQILDLEHGRTEAAIQMKLETSMENRLWATRMTKHVMEINKHLQTRLLDLMQCRLLRPDSASTQMSKKLKVEYSSP